MKKLKIIMSCYCVFLFVAFFICFFLIESPKVVYVSIDGKFHPDLYVYEHWGDLPLLLVIFSLLSIPALIYFDLIGSDNNSIK